MSKRQQNIKELLKILRDKEGVSNRKIAEKIGLSPQQLHYHLNSSPELDKDIYEKIVKELKRFGLEAEDKEITTTEVKNSADNSSPGTTITSEEKEMLEILKEAGYTPTKLRIDLATLKNIKHLMVGVEERKEVEK